MKRIVLSLLVITAIPLTLCSCGHVQKQGLSPQQRFPELYGKIDAFYAAGNTNELITHLSQAMRNSRYETEHPRLLQFLMNHLCETRKHERAEAEFIYAITNSPTAASSSLGYLNHQYLTVLADSKRALDWNTRLLSMPPPENMEPRLYELRIGILLRDKDMAAIKGSLKICITKFSDTTSSQIARRVISGMIKAKQLDDATAIIDLVDSMAKDSPLLRATADSSRVSILTQRAQWAALEKLLRNMAPRTEDHLLSGPFSAAASNALKNRQWNTVDRLCELIINSHPDKQRTRRKAASLWTDCARLRGDLTAVPDRIDKLDAITLPVNELFLLVSRNFYAVMTDGNKQAKNSMFKYSNELLEKLEDENEIEQLSTYIVDGAFMMENYDLAITMLESGIPGRTAQWHKMAISKLKAHRAMKSGKTKEAIGFFREFMATIKRDEDDKVDPVTRVAHSSEWTLGYNARRIGDLYTSMKDTKSAAIAYAEARDYYRIALKKAEEDSPEKQQIRAELEKVPKAK